MSQVGHIVAAQNERAIGHVYSSLRISVPIRFSELAVLTVKFVSTAGWTTSGRLIDSVQGEGRIFEQMVSRAGLQPNRININIDAYSRSFLGVKMALEALGLKSSCV
jgi:hypothetical protein